MALMVPGGREPVAEVTVQTETEGDRGWTFGVAVAWPGGGRSAHTVHLSWADYEHWSHGRVAPEKVARAVVEIVTERRGEGEVPPRFDASTARRWLPGLDAEMAERV